MQNANEPNRAFLQPLELRRISVHRGIRALTWDREILYGCRGYDVVRLRTVKDPSDWEVVAHFQPPWWRSLTSRFASTFRLMRDGFHALTLLDDNTIIAVVPGAIVTCTAGDNEFRVTHRILRGTRPLHITATPYGRIYWGEYFDNRERSEVHIYASDDRGLTWQVAHTFPSGSIRHVHNIVYDRWGSCLWILTGDEGAECRILRASCDLRSIETVISGNQQARAVAAIPTKDALYLSTDTPHEKNHVYRLDRADRLESVGSLSSSSIYGCQAGNSLFFSTMVEPSRVNPSREVKVFGSREGWEWQVALTWGKDVLPMRYFQYGNAILPDGENATSCLAVTTIAVREYDLTTTLWKVE